MAPTPRQQGKTPHRGLRVDDDLWETFGRATADMGVDRSTWLRDAIRWCVREPGVKMPKRPLSPAGTSGDAD